MKSLEESKLTTYPVNFFITKVFVSVIKKYMEPVGFAYNTLINDFKLLEHLRCLRRVFFVQILEPFVQTLFREVTPHPYSIPNSIHYVWYLLDIILWYNIFEYLLKVNIQQKIPHFQMLIVEILKNFFSAVFLDCSQVLDASRLVKFAAK